MSHLFKSCEAVVLHHTNYGEADTILTLFSAEYGLQKGFARSARKSRKRFGAVLDPFTQATFLWKPGRGDLLLLQEAELVTSRVGLRSDFQRLSLASYGAELVLLLLEDGEPHPHIYELLCGFLDYLAAGGELPTARLLFELRLVYLLGYMPHLLHCSECLKIFSDEPIRFDASRGGSLCLDCAGSMGLNIDIGSVGSLARSLKVVHYRFDGFQFGEKTIREAGQLLDQVLRHVLPREPKSRRFLAGE